jgi:ATP-binding cassette subfamily B protein
MSRHIEYDQKNEVYAKYQALDAGFYKTHNTGDLMSRITEDVSRVRMYTGPAIMYLINLVTLIGLALYYMLKKDVTLTLYVLAPLPVLAITIYFVNSIINKKSEKIQGLLSNLTTNAQETYAGIRVIKSFVQEKAMLSFFEKNSEDYKKNAIDLAKVESIYFPSMALLIGLSTIVTIFLGGLQALQDPSRVGVIVEFVIYINMLTFPVSAIGWTASMIQRAAASQKRLNEFLDILEKVIQEDTIPLEVAERYLNIFLGPTDWKKNINKLWEISGSKSKDVDSRKAFMKRAISCAVLLPYTEKSQVPSPPENLLFWCTAWVQFNEYQPK